MSRYDDEENSFDESEETDPIVRELRTEIVRLEAQLDQLLAGVREQVEESALIRVKLMELEEAVQRLKARQRRDEIILIVSVGMVIISIGMSLYTYLAA